jgi:hypothetical protein
MLNGETGPELKCSSLAMALAVSIVLSRYKTHIVSIH